MRSFHRLLSLVALMLFFNACASGGGQAPEDDTGFAALSLQLQGLEEGEIYLTPDGYRLTFEHFAFAFSAIQLDDFETVAPFAADFFDEEVPDLIEIEDIPAGEYEGVVLTLGRSEAGEAQRFLRVRGLKNAESPPPDLAGLSVFLQAQAIKGSEQCTIRVALLADGESLEVDPEGNVVEVEGGEEAEILVEVDPNAVFSGVDLAGFCSGGETVTISATEHTSLAERIVLNLATAFQLGSAEGHHHH